MDPRLIKIVLTGPESSGKSALGQSLSKQLGWPLLKEYARFYLEKHGPQYDWDGFLHMYQQHCRSISQLSAEHSGPLLIDTDEINFLVWSEQVFSRPLPDQATLSKRLQNRFYLLLRPDLPWQPDPLRQDENRRHEIFERHTYWLKVLNLPFVEISGTGKERVERALNALKQEIELVNGHSKQSP